MQLTLVFADTVLHMHCCYIFVVKDGAVGEN